MIFMKNKLIYRLATVILMMVLAFPSTVFSEENATEKVILQNSFDSATTARNDNGATLPYSKTADFRQGGGGGAGYSMSADHTGNSGGSLTLGGGSAFGRVKFLNTVESDRLLTEDDVGRSFKVAFWAKANVGKTPTIYCGMLSIESTKQLRQTETPIVLSETWQECTYNFTVTSDMITSKAYCFTIEGHEDSRYNDFFIDDLKIIETAQGAVAPTAPVVPMASGSTGGKTRLSNSFNSAATARNDNGATLPHSKTADFRQGGSGGAGYSASADHTGNSGGSLTLGSNNAFGRVKFLNTVESDRLLTTDDIGRSFKATFWAKANAGKNVTVYYGLLSIAATSRPSGGIKELSEEWQEITYEFTITSNMIESTAYCFSIEGDENSRFNSFFIDDLVVAETTPDGSNSTAEKIELSQNVVIKDQFVESVYSDIKGTAHEIPVGLLSALGVMKGDNNGNFNPDTEMSRIEFLEAVMRLSGYTESEANNLPSSFVDVTSSSPSSWAVRTAENTGIIHGVGDSKFNPNDIITTEQAIKIIVSAIGYNYKAEAMGGYPMGYMAVAATERISSSSANANVTRGAAALMLYNTSRIDINRTVGVANGTVLADTPRGYTILTHGFGITKATGYITGTPNTRLTDENGVNNGYVEIDNTTYLYGTSGAEKLLGLHVDYYYKENENGDLELVYALPTRNNSMLIIPAKWITNYQNRTYEYNLNDNDKLRKVTVPFAANIIYNGQFTVPTIDIMRPIMGEVRLLDSNGDGNYETIFIEDITYCIVDRVSVRDWVIYNKYPLKDSESIFDFSDVSENIAIFNTDGVARRLQNIVEYDVVAVRASLGAERLVSLSISANKTEGIVTELSEETISIDDVSYDISHYFKKLVDTKKLSLPTLGTSIKLLTDSEGTAVGYVPSTSGSKQYGYLIKTEIRKSLDSTVQLLVLTSAGKVEVLSCANKISVDGNDRMVAETAMSTLGSIGSITRQLIGYHTNSDGVIISIDTALRGINETEYNLNKTFPEEGIDSPTHSNGWSFRSASSSFNGRCNIGNDTVVFWVANDENAEDSFYYVTNSSALASGGGVSYNIEGYTNRNIENYADFLVIKHNGIGQIGDYSDIFLVNKITTISNDNGEIRNKLHGISGGGETSIIVNDQSAVLDSVNPGDIVRVVAGINNEVLLPPRVGSVTHTNFQHILEVNGDNGAPLFKFTSTSYTGSLFLVGGRVADIRDGFIWVDINASPTRRAIKLSGFKIYVFDKKRNCFEEGEPGDINTGDFAVVRMVEAAPRQIIIYK